MRKAEQAASCLLALVSLVACSEAWAGVQAASAATNANSSAPEYEVATVKVNNTGSGSIRVSITSDLLQATNIPLATMLEVAFDIRPEQIVGLPHWAQVDHYDITAKVVDMNQQQLHGLSEDQRRTMIQHLLANRFHLQSHTEKRTLPLLELAVAKEGIKFAEWKKPVDDQSPNQGKGYMRVNNDEMSATGVTMDRLIRFLSSQTHMPIMDKTGLKGNYNFQLKWQREEAGPESGLHDQTLPSIYVALPEQLGLKLESAKGPVDVLVVDHIEQPSEN
jgi:bla regulator protein blaR1